MAWNLPFTTVDVEHTFRHTMSGTRQRKNAVLIITASRIVSIVFAVSLEHTVFDGIKEALYRNKLQFMLVQWLQSLTLSFWSFFTVANLSTSSFVPQRASSPIERAKKPPSEASLRPAVFLLFIWKLPSIETSFRLPPCWFWHMLVFAIIIFVMHSKLPHIPNRRSCSLDHSLDWHGLGHNGQVFCRGSMPNWVHRWSWEQSR